MASMNTRKMIPRAPKRSTSAKSVEAAQFGGASAADAVSGAVNAITNTGRMETIRNTRPTLPSPIQSAMGSGLTPSNQQDLNSWLTAQYGMALNTQGTTAPRGVQPGGGVSGAANTTYTPDGRPFDQGPLEFFGDIPILGDILEGTGLATSDSETYPVAEHGGAAASAAARSGSYRDAWQSPNVRSNLETIVKQYQNPDGSIDWDRLKATDPESWEFVKRNLGYEEYVAQQGTPTYQDEVANKLDEAEEIDAYNQELVQGNQGIYQDVKGTMSETQAGMEDAIAQGDQAVAEGMDVLREGAEGARGLEAGAQGDLQTARENTSIAQQGAMAAVQARISSAVDAIRTDWDNVKGSLLGNLGGDIQAATTQTRQDYNASVAEIDAQVASGMMDPAQAESLKFQARMGAGQALGDTRVKMTEAYRNIQTDLDKTFGGYVKDLESTGLGEVGTTARQSATDMARLEAGGAEMVGNARAKSAELLGRIGESISNQGQTWAFNKASLNNMIEQASITGNGFLAGLLPYTIEPPSVMHQVRSDFYAMWTGLQAQETDFALAEWERTAGLASMQAETTQANMDALAPRVAADPTSGSPDYTNLTTGFVSPFVGAGANALFSGAPAAAPATAPSSFMGSGGTQSTRDAYDSLFNQNFAGPYSQ